MRGWFSAILSALLIAAAQPAWAGEAKGPLAPGKAAGIQTAQTQSQLDKIAIFGGLGLGVLAVYFIVGTKYHNPNGSGGQSASGTN